MIVDDLSKQPFGWLLAQGFPRDEARDLASPRNWRLRALIPSLRKARKKNDAERDPVIAAALGLPIKKTKQRPSKRLTWDTRSPEALVRENERIRWRLEQALRSLLKQRARVRRNRGAQMTFDEWKSEMTQRADDAGIPIAKLTFGQYQDECVERGTLARTPNGDINNCAVASGALALDCQVCGGKCPDAVRLFKQVASKSTPLVFKLADMVQATPLEAGLITSFAHTSDSAEHYTPYDIVAAATVVLGGTIDLDPASNEVANGYVEATKYYDAAANGLTKEWHGTVFLNPPGGLCDQEGRPVYPKTSKRAGCTLTGACGAPSWPQAQGCHQQCQVLVAEARARISRRARYRRGVHWVLDRTALQYPNGRGRRHHPDRWLDLHPVDAAVLLARRRKRESRGGWSASACELHRLPRPRQPRVCARLRSVRQGADVSRKGGSKIVKDAKSQLARVLAAGRKRTGRDATVTELLRWASVYRAIAEALTERAIAAPVELATK